MKIVLFQLRVCMKCVIKLLSRIFLFLLFIGNSSLLAMTLGDRPESVQHLVDQQFELVRNRTTWGFNGSSAYNLLRLDDDKFLEDFVHKILRDRPEATDVYILDVGCGNALWGDNAMNVIAQVEREREINRTIYIYSVTGGLECQNRVNRNGNVIHTVFNQFKIENLDEEFLARGVDLRNNVDLIVSQWTFMHFVDGFGTLKRMYSLLRPYFGMAMFNKFEFYYRDSSNNTNNLDSVFEVLLASNASTLMLKGKPTQTSFLVKRTDEQKLIIPLTYGALYKPICWACMSDHVLYVGDIPSVPFDWVDKYEVLDPYPHDIGFYHLADDSDAITFYYKYRRSFLSSDAAIKPPPIPPISQKPEFID